MSKRTTRPKFLYEMDDSSISRGVYEAWVVGVDRPTMAGAAGVSAFAWEICHSGTSEIVANDARASDEDNSDETRAIVAAVYRIVEALQDGSSVTIYCRNKFAVDGINGDVDRWRMNEWRRSDGKPVKHSEIWRRFVTARDGTDSKPRNIHAIAEHRLKRDRKDREIFDRLTEDARALIAWRAANPQCSAT